MAFTFVLPPELSAKEPPERRGIRRDQVRLLVIERATGKIEHTRFDKIDKYLRPGDLLVFNSSRTLPASLRGCECSAAHGPCMEVRLAERLPDDSWLARLLCEQGDPFGCGLRAGMQIEFAEGLAATVLERDINIPRLWKLRFSISGTELVDLIYRLGKPIRYEYVSAPWELDYYQTVYATEPGSAEMPSAGRAFTWKLLLDLKRCGIDSAYIVLHTGLSSYMDDELDRTHPASEEEYFVSRITAEKINQARENEGRVVAVGTTVVRALETVAGPEGTVAAGRGWTSLVITPQRGLWLVDGLITGWHEPEASHLEMLEASAGEELLARSYDAALGHGYMWHEFGDSHLVMP
jgi:S-adenosylmethionine:tRNA ribosyltransferase-isomerase